MLKNFELRDEYLNAFKNINFVGVTCAGSAATCGQLTGTIQGARWIQIAARLNF